MTLGAAARALRVRLIGKVNGVGLSRDFDLLAGALRDCGCEVLLHGCERRDRKRRRSLLMQISARARLLRLGRRRSLRSEASCDANIMLEHVWPQFLHQARCNVLVPNPEWFDRRDRAFLDAIDRVWAKTSLAQRLFTERGRPTSLIGFDSEDRYQSEVPRRPQFFHLAGRSPLKGTSRLMALWQRHPLWPQLLVIQDGSVKVPQAANIVYTQGYLDDAALRTLQNEYRFHLCMSEAEGWGHYLVEAMSVGAVVLTLDAPPMNELVSLERGLLVGGHEGARHNLATLCRFDEAALEQAISQVMSLSPAQLQGLGDAARAWFLANKRQFVARVQRAVAEISALLGVSRPMPATAAGRCGDAV